MFLGCSLLLLAGAGCAAGTRGAADALLAGDPARARDLARERLARDESDAGSWRDLGIALYRLDRSEEALDPLGHSLTLEPRDRAALLFHARTLDRLGQRGPAIAAYTSYLARAQERHENAVVRARVEQLRRERIEEETRSALAREDSLRSAPTGDGIAIPDFANPASSDTLRAIAKGLALLLAIDLARIEPLRILERHRLRALLAELRGGPTEPSPGAAMAADPVSTVRGQQQRLTALIDPNTGQPYYAGPADGLLGPRFTSAILAFQRANLLESDGVAGRRTQIALDRLWRVQASRAAGAGAIDPRSAPRLARLLGAGRFVQGSVFHAGAGGLELRVDLLDASGTPVMRTGAIGGEIATSDPVTGPFREILRLEKRLAIEVLRLLGTPAGEEERRLLEQVETRDVDAFLAFCRGLDLEDRGRRAEALAAYRDAAAHDPGFTLAEIYGGALAVDGAALDEIETREIRSLRGRSTDRSSRATGSREGASITPGRRERSRPDAPPPRPSSLRGA